jgi:hypothetical protein
MLHNLVRRVRRKLHGEGLIGEDIVITVQTVGYRLG